MKINQDAEVFQRAHEALVDEHSIHLNPPALITVLETVLEDRVTKTKADEQVQAAKKQLRRKHADLSDATKALTIARDFIATTVVWQGAEERRDETLGQLDRAITYFTP